MDGTDALAGTTDQAPPAASPQPAAAAAPSQTATPAAPIATQDAAPSTAQIQQQDAPAYTPPAEQPAAAPQAPPQRPGLAGILDAVADMLSPRPTTVSRDDNGNNVVTQQPQSRGAQWANIGLTALHGAVTAAAAPPGPGHVGRGVSAALEQGIQTQQDQANQAQTNADKTFQQKQQAKLNNINYQLLSRKLVANEFELQQSQVKAGQDAVTFSNNLMDRERTLGSYDLGTYKDASEIPSVMAKQPQFMQRLYKEQGIIAIPQFAPDGTRTGVQLFERKQDVNSQPAPDGTVAHKWTLGDKPGDPPHMTTFVPVGATNGDIFRYDAKAMVDAQAYAKEQADLTQKAAQAAEEKANASKAPSEIAKNNADAAKANAEAAKAKAPSADSPEIATLGEAVARGMLTTDKIPDRDKNKPAIQAYLALHHPNLDQNSVFMDGNERKQVNLAGNAIHNLDSISSILQRRPDLLGIVDGRISQGKELAGTNDPDITAIGTALDNYGLASTGAHGVKAVQAREDAKKAITNGFKNGPQGVQSAIQTAKGSLQNLASAGKPRGMDGTPYVYKQQGGPTTPNAAPQQTPQWSPQQIQQIQQKAAAAGVPANAHAATDQAGNVVGYQDATGYHTLGAK